MWLASSANRDAGARSQRLVGGRSRAAGLGCLGSSRLAAAVLGRGLAVQEAALLDRAAGLEAGDAADGASGHGAIVVHGRGQMGDVFGDGVLGADCTGIDAVALAGLGHGVVARVKVLAVLEMLGEVVGARRQLAVEAEEALLFGG